jgi:hypothetical protein
LQNIALSYDKDITLKIDFAKMFKYFFKISSKQNNYDEYVIKDNTEKINFIPYEKYKQSLVI